MSKLLQHRVLAAMAIGLFVFLHSNSFTKSESAIGQPLTVAENPTISQSEDLHLELEATGWKIGFAAEHPNDNWIVEHIREGDDIHNWQEMVTVHDYFLNPRLGSLDDWFNATMKRLEQLCPGNIKWNIIKRDKNSILYEWQEKSCPEWPDQHEIARIIDGKYNRFIIRYTAKVYQLNPNQRSMWIERFSKANVVLK